MIDIMSCMLSRICCICGEFIFLLNSCYFIQDCINSEIDRGYCGHIRVSTVAASYVIHDVGVVALVMRECRSMYSASDQCTPLATDCAVSYMWGGSIGSWSTGWSRWQGQG